MYSTSINREIGTLTCNNFITKLRLCGVCLAMGWGRNEIYFRFKKHILYNGIIVTRSVGKLTELKEEAVRPTMIVKF